MITLIPNETKESIPQRKPFPKFVHRKIDGRKTKTIYLALNPYDYLIISGDNEGTIQHTMEKEWVLGTSSDFEDHNEPITLQNKE